MHRSAPDTPGMMETTLAPRPAVLHETDQDIDPLASARGVIIGALLGGGLWAGIFTVVWQLFR
jgi:hypothetical protein